MTDETDPTRIADPTDLARRAVDILRHANRQQRITNAEFSDLVDRLWSGSGPLAPHHIVGVQGIAELGDVGQRALLNQSWNGMKLLI